MGNDLLGECVPGRGAAKERPREFMTFAIHGPHEQLGRNGYADVGRAVGPLKTKYGDAVRTPKEKHQSCSQTTAKCPNCRREILEKTLVEPT